jgi:hypothetical protein
MLEHRTPAAESAVIEGLCDRNVALIVNSATDTPGFHETSGAKTELIAPTPAADAPPTPHKLLAALAQLSSRPIQELLATAVADELRLTRRRGRPQALDAAARQQVCLLLKFGYSRALAAAELGVARSTITRTMQRNPEFRQQVLEAEMLYDRTPLLTILQAAQTSWKAAAWLIKHHKPHQSVARRRERQKAKESMRRTRDFFEGVRDATKKVAAS